MIPAQSNTQHNLDQAYKHYATGANLRVAMSFDTMQLIFSIYATFYTQGFQCTGQKLTSQ